MRELSLEELLEAGCHFGHQVTRQNPKSRDFVFEARDNIHIIDLAKTKEGLEEAARFVKDLAARGGNMVVVATKRQARGIVAEELERMKNEGADGIFPITRRWVGGILTNFSEVSKNFKKLHDLTKKLTSEEEQIGYTKKEIGLWDRERQILEGFYGGVAQLSAMPDSVFIIDTHLEDLAVREAQKTGITTVGIVDTNADPAAVDYPIPANDDAVGSIKLIVSYIVDAWIEGRRKLEKDKKTATTETQKEPEAQKPSFAEKSSDSAIAREASDKTTSETTPKTTKKRSSKKSKTIDASQE